MKQIGVEELKNLQLDILSYYDEFCKKNGIQYWIDYGTLLGAVRHKGFIPWDDDVDITMLRKDYNRAAELFNQQTDGRYVFQTPFNDRKARYPFGKLIDKKTVLYEYGETGIKTGVYIDVFVYDNAPSEKTERDRIFKKRDFLGRVRRLQLPMRKGIGKGKKVVYFIGSTILRLVPAGYINRALDRNARRNENVETGMVSTFVDPYDPTYFAVPKKIFQDQTTVEFEGKMFPAPRDYDFWLKKLYGNYMELPPVEKRVHQHAFEAYYLDD